MRTPGGGGGAGGEEESACHTSPSPQTGCMSDVEPQRPGKWFAWAAVLAGLVPTLWAGGLVLYLLALSIGLFTASDRANYVGFLLTLVTLLSATLVGYWRVVWCCLEGRRVSTPLWFGSCLLMLAWLGWCAWGMVRSHGAFSLLGAGMSLMPFALWGYALKRTF